MKKTIIIIIISLLVTAGNFVLSKYHNRDKMMTQMNKDIQDYYYISCPNGNELDGVKILGNGELTKNLTVKAAKFSAAAKEKIEKAGGKVEVM